MNRITRYMLHQTAFVTLFVCAAFSVAVWLVQSLRLVDLIVNRGLSAGLFLYLALLILPRFIEVVLPIAVFVAVLFVYNKLIAESELVVMRAAGMSQSALARAALIVGIGATILLYALSLYMLPAANRGFKDLQFKIRNRFASVLIQEGVFNTLSDRLMVYVTSRNAAGELVSLLIYDTRDPEKPVTVFAERGAVVDTPDGPRMLMVNGTRQQRNNLDGHLTVLSFTRYTLDLSEFGDVPGGRDRQPDERYTSELLFPAAGASPDSARALFVELNLRLAGPLTALSMAALPILCLLSGEFNRRGQPRRVLVAIGLAFLLELFDIGLKDLAGRSDVAVPLLYVNALIPIAALLWFLWRDAAGDLPIRLIPRPAR
ncbi:MAG TPA: LptF/LptG family permease [Stellaceae bacterium]|nr:LptF/LptG family permease [Stellaceae bacterium]